jgi:uncharacterized protein (TIGR03067 family)
MRLVTIFFTSCIILGCTSAKKTTMTLNKLNGTWIPVRQEMNGTQLPAPTFEKQQLIINDSAYTVIAESIDKGVIRYHDDKMDIYGKEGVNSGKHFTAIYKSEAGQLTVCYNLAGDSYPETFETKGKPLYFLSVFKKDMAK